MATGLVMVLLIVLWEFGRLAPALATADRGAGLPGRQLRALELTGITLNISSFMGVIMVTGHHRQERHPAARPRRARRRRWLDRPTALADAATVRLRPIMMTTLATAAGLLPLALGYGAGAKVQQPLAVAVIGGLVLAMLLSSRSPAESTCSAHPTAASVAQAMQKWGSHQR